MEKDPDIPKSIIHRPGKRADESTQDKASNIYEVPKYPLKILFFFIHSLVPAEGAAAPTEPQNLPISCFLASSGP